MKKITFLICAILYSYLGHSIPQSYTSGAMLFEETAGSYSTVTGYPWNVATTTNGLSFTIEHWIKFNDNLGTNVAYINTIGYDDNNSFIEIVDDGVVYYRASGLNKARTVAGSFPNDGQYHHVAIVYDESLTSGSRHSIYIDGVSVALQSQPDLTTAIPDQGAGNTFNIGRTTTNPFYSLDGEIDELRFWSDVRTPSEITSNMHSSLIGTEQGLVAYYNYEEGSGTTAADVTGNGFNSTLINTTNANWVTRSGNSVDTTAPVITLTGDATVNIEIGSTYNDAGATANDDTDGDITGNINTVNPVNTSVAATYTVTYNVSDAAGNAATEVTRTVNVIDVALSGTPTNASCSDATDGSVALTPSGGTAPYVYGETLYQDTFAGTINSGNYTATTMTNGSSGNDELQITATSGWNSRYVTNQNFTREAYLTFEGSVFIPYDLNKLVMIGFHDPTANETSSVSHGIFFDDNGTTSPVSVTARAGTAGGFNFPTTSYVNNQSPGKWFDVKITLGATQGATYYVKESGEANYTNSVYVANGNLTTFKVGVAASTPSSGTVTYTLHKNWRVYKDVPTSGLGVGSYTYHVTDANGFTEQVSVSIANGDTTDPGVTITNGSPTTHEAYTTYNDAGATATDNCSSGATITNTVNNVPANPAPGNYTVVYTATDTNGNTSTGTRNVTVTDTTAPSLSSISMVSNNSNTSQADLNDEITLSFTASEVINTPTVVIAGETATVSHQGGNVWNATITVDSDTTEGDASFTISNITDGTNSASDVTALSNGNSPVDIDRTSPSAPSVAPDLIASSDTGREDDDNLTKDNTPTFTISGFTAEPGDVVKIYDGGTSGTLLATSAALTGGETSVDITSSTLSDGNSFSITTTITDNFNRESAESTAFTALVVDTEAPTATFVSVGLNVGSYPVNNTMREVNAQDKGFQLAIQFSETMDHWNANFPTLTYTPDGSTPVGSQDPTTGFTTGNGIPNSLFYFRSDPVDNNTEFDDIDIQVSGSTDYAGNVMTTVTFTDAFSIDMIGPSGDENTVLASSKSAQGGATITLDANVPAGETAWLVPSGSTINQLFSFTANGSTITSSAVGGNTITAPTTSGTYQLYVLDDVHNFTSPATATISVDNTNPSAVAQNLTIQLDSNGDASITGAQVNNGSTDNSGGTLTYSVSPDSFTCANLGANTVTLTVTDPAGNTDTATATVTVEDDEDPVITITNGNVTHEAYTTYTDAGATVSDNCSASITNTVNNVPTNVSLLHPGIYTVVYTATDAGNNVVTATRTVTVVDTTDPVAVAQDVTVQLDASGNASITATQINNGSSDNSNGNLTYAVSPNTFDCGNVGQDCGANSLNFDGTTYAGNANGPNITNISDSGFTLEAWVKPTSLGGVNSVIRKDGDYNLYFNGGVLTADVWNGSSFLTRVINTGPSPALNTWSHIAFVWNGAAGVFYINGTQYAGNLSPFGTQAATNNPFEIGQSTTFVQNFVGNIDDVRLWSTQRTSTEINDNYAKCLSGSETGLQIYFKTLAGSGSVLRDFSPNGYDATIYGANWSVDAPPLIGVSNVVTLTVTDPSGNTDTATATVTVEDNINPTITLNGDANMTVIMPGTFTDPGATPADNCYATVQVSGTVDTNTPGTYVLTYTAVDGSGNQSTPVTRSVFVNGLPTASDDTVTVDEDDVEYVINVMNNDDYGPDGAGFISITTASTNGTAVVDGNTIKYTPTARATSDSLIYTVEDSNGDTVSATVNITINRLPSGTDSSFTVEEDSTSNDLNTIANNDFDLDGPGSVDLISGTTSQGGTVSINQNGTANDVTDDTFTYTPVVQFVGTDTFQYTITDGNGDTSSAITVTIDVVAVVPVAANDNPTIKEDYTNQVLNILANDTFRDTTTDDLVSFTISGATASQGGAISINTNGTTDPADDTVIYTPVTQFVGQETFTYTLTDANGDSDTGTVTIDVVPVIPQPKDDNFTVNQDTENHVFNLFADNGNGADGYETTSPDTLISFTISGTNTTANGTLILNDQGTPEPWDDTVTYSPRATYNGNDSFTYTLLDENGDSASATVNIIVRPIVPVPVDDTATATKNSSNNIINVLDNDDFGGNGPNTTHPLTFRNGSLTSASDEGGTLIISPNGTPGDLTDDVILYTPRADFTGVDTFKYIITDVDGDAGEATVTITVSAGSGGMATPTATDDTATFNANSTENAVNVLANDQPGLDGYIDNGLTMLNGTSSGATAQGGSVTVDNKNTNDTTDDVITYTPAAGYTGTDTFQYTITDASGDASTATVNITVNAVTDVPNAVDDTKEVDQNSSNNSITILTNDSAGTDGLSSITLSATTAGGTISINDNSTPVDLTDDTVNYTPATDYVGQDSFTYTLEDSNGDTSTATVVVTVLPVTPTNGTPSAVDDTASATQGGGTITIDVLDNDNYGSDGPNATHQLTFTNGAIKNASANGAHIEVVNNKIEYTPTGTFTGTDTFTYVITDGSGDADRADVVVTITAGAGGLATPTANDDSTTTNADSGVKVIDVLANDTPGIDGYADGGLTMTNGTLNSASANGGAISVDQKGTSDTTDDVFNYTPPAGFTGTDTFQYTITDDSGDADTATVTVVVSAITDAPNAVDDAETVTTDVATSIDVLDNDSYGTDNAAAVDPLTVSGTTTEGGTTSVVANQVVYTSPSGFSGVDTFTYTITDGSGDTDTATVTVTVSATPVNNGTPTANDDSANATQAGSVVTIDVLDNDDYGSDGPNATHQLTFKNGATVNASTNGAQIAVVNNQIEYTPTASFSGTDTFEYIITDGSGDADRATVTVTVASSGSGGGSGGGSTNPVATNDTETVDKDSSTNTIDVLANDQIGSAGFIAGHGLRLQGGLSERYTDQGGFLRVNENGTPNDATDDTIEYTPAPGYSGADSFSYTITNGDGISATATVSITVQVPRTSSTEGQSFSNSFTVYPNPSKGYVKTTVESATSGKATVYLVDTVGKIIYKSEVNLIEGNNNLEFDFRVSTGVMYLKIIGSTNYGTKKIIFE
ncbi:MAG: hypothetical protein CMB99_15365 [Flavobacteriaceae bacterium]|nr:hypothetical protein [Flavobacteriaceae bacterium]|tara:strand:- start:386862 stop:395897 length:9036 start_codon:yes stop_codon:yes gene_type:complete